MKKRRFWWTSWVQGLCFGRRHLESQAVRKLRALFRSSPDWSNGESCWSPVPRLIESCIEQMGSVGEPLCHQPKLWQPQTSSKSFFLRMSFFFVSCFIGCVTFRTWFASLKIFATQLSSLFAIEWFRHDQSFFTGSESGHNIKSTMKSIEIHCSFVNQWQFRVPFSWPTWLFRPISPRQRCRFHMALGFYNFARPCWRQRWAESSCSKG